MKLYTKVSNLIQNSLSQNLSQFLKKHVQNGVIVVKSKVKYKTAQNDRYTVILYVHVN